MRIDTHHHMIPPDYRTALEKARIADSGGRGLPEWSAEASLDTMSELSVVAAVLSVSTPGTTFLSAAADAAALARDVNVIRQSSSRRTVTDSDSSPPYRCPTSTPR